MSEGYTVGQYLVDRLRQLGLEHLFSIAGDYSIEWFNRYVTPSSIEIIEEVNEVNAGYAADGYARLKGIGACVTLLRRRIVCRERCCWRLRREGAARIDQWHAEHKEDSHLRADRLQRTSLHQRTRNGFSVVRAYNGRSHKNRQS